eukprot:297566-Rhodomonas_salina.3
MSTARVDRQRHCRKNGGERTYRVERSCFRPRVLSRSPETTTATSRPINREKFRTSQPEPHLLPIPPCPIPPCKRPRTTECYCGKRTVDAAWLFCRCKGNILGVLSLRPSPLAPSLSVETLAAGVDGCFALLRVRRDSA